MCFGCLWYVGLYRLIIVFVIYNNKITICYNSDMIEICFTHVSVLRMISISFVISLHKVL